MAPTFANRVQPSPGVHRKPSPVLQSLIARTCVTSAGRTERIVGSGAPGAISRVSGGRREAGHQVERLLGADMT